MTLPLPPKTHTMGIHSNTTSHHHSHDEVIDIFSPVSNAFFHPMSIHHTAITTSLPLQPTTTTPLPPSHDSSWIGARLSPIHRPMNDDDDDEDVEVETVVHSDDDDDDDDTNLTSQQDYDPNDDRDKDDDDDDDFRPQHDSFFPPTQHHHREHRNLTRIQTSTTTGTATPPPPPFDPPNNTVSTTTHHHHRHHYHPTTGTTTTNTATTKHQNANVTTTTAHERSPLLLVSTTFSSSLPNQRRPMFVVNGTIQNDIPPQVPPKYHYPTVTAPLALSSMVPNDVPGSTTAMEPSVRNHYHPQQRSTNHHHHHHHLHSNFHPLWKSPSYENHHDDHKGHRRPLPTTIITTMWTKSKWIGHIDRIGMFCCSISGCILMGMAYTDHQLNRLYLWTGPYFRPNLGTLIHYGALSPDVQIQNHILASGSATFSDYIYFINDILVLRPYLQCITSLVLCTCVLEWWMVVMAWILMYCVADITTPSLQNNSNTTTTMKSPKLDYSSSSPTSSGAGSTTTIPTTTTTSYTFPRWYQIVSCYILSAWTGQLWFLAFEINTVVGCASWGTVGTLCMMGILRPMYRFELFLSAACFVIVSQLLRPYSSVYGTTMSALFGWSMASCGYIVPGNQPGVVYVGNNNDLRGMKSTTFMGTAGMVLLVSIPVLFLAFKKNNATYYG